MPAALQFFDMSVSITPPTGHFEPLPITLGPNWQPGDVRMMFVSGSAQAQTSGAGGDTSLDIPMDPDPPTGFTASYSRTPGSETHGTYFSSLVTGDTSASVVWPKPAYWQYFMLGLLTVRGVSPTVAPTAGSLSLAYQTGDATGTVATASSVSVPSAGTMIFFVGNIGDPGQSSWPKWPVALGAPTGWTNLVATDKSGATFYPYDTSLAVIAVGRTFASAGSTGAVTFQTAQGAPALAGMWAFLTPAADVSATIGAV